jgi:amidase
VPILLKDNIATADRLHTSAGSLALKDCTAPADAFLVTTLRAAGAIILGKVNMTEWANFMATNMPAGYSSRGGQVVNPYSAAASPGGSSSGSGAAVAAGFCSVAVGTETQGSILSPASSNGVVGIKPTLGLISRAGIVPISASQDTAGPLAKTVADAAALLSVIAGHDPADAATRPARRRAATDYLAYLDPDGLKGARIGVPPLSSRVPEPEKPAFQAAVGALRDAGATVIDPCDVPTAKALEDFRSDVLLYEFKRDLNRYLRRLGEDAAVHSLRELIRYNEARPREMLRYGQVLLLAAQSAAGPRSQAYRHSRSEDLRLAKTEGIDAVLKRDRLDALLFPGPYGSPMGAKPGYPSICVPGGYTAEGAPVGITFTGPAWSEPTLIRLAYAFEQATGHRKPPLLT